jgi:hypothetical protein
MPYSQGTEYFNALEEWARKEAAPDGGKEGH